MNIFVMDIKE